MGKVRNKVEYHLTRPLTDLSSFSVFLSNALIQLSEDL